jgi:hypothetical protein
MAWHGRLSAWGTRVAKPRDDRQRDRLRPGLEDIIDLGHPLVRLARAIDWQFLDQRFSSVCPAFGNDAAQFLKIRHPLFRIAFLVFQRLFLRVSFICCNAQPMLLIRTPKCCARSRNSASG